MYIRGLIPRNLAETVPIEPDGMPQSTKLHCTRLRVSSLQIIKVAKLSTVYPMLLHQCIRVKSGNFGHQVNSDSDFVCFIF